MKICRINILVIILLLAGCAPLQLLMEIDPSLKTNAKVYEVKHPDTWTDKRLNVSFGPYQVTDVDFSWRKKVDSPGLGLHLLEHMGLTVPGADIRTVSQSHTYKFKIGNNITWDAECGHNLKKREVESKTVAIIEGQSGFKVEIEDPDKNASTLELVSSIYTCRYWQEGYEPWVLYVEKYESSQLYITLTNKEHLFKAHATTGVYVRADGRPYKLSAPIAGYTWTKDNNNIAAISAGEKTPKVWLDKRNPDSTNDVLSMASTGLLIYHLKAAPQVKN